MVLSAPVGMISTLKTFIVSELMTGEIASGKE